MNNHYTYVYLDPRKPGIWVTSEITFNFEPFYIGEGKNGRAFQHLKDKSGSSKSNKIQKLLSNGLVPIIIKVKEGISGDEALALEASLIRQIGTIADIETVSRGPLLNLKIQDGKKHIVSEETKQLKSRIMKGRPRTSETVAKWRESFEKNKSPESRKRRSDAQRNPNPERRAKISQGQRGRVTSAETKIKLSATTTIKNSKSWKIIFENGVEETVVNLKSWCASNDLKYGSVKHTAKSGKYYKGIQVKYY